MRKVVGDGRSIQAFRDPWIPQPRTFRPITTAPSGGPRGDVSGVGDGVAGGCWDEPSEGAVWYARLDGVRRRWPQTYRSSRRTALGLDIMSIIIFSEGAMLISLVNCMMANSDSSKIFIDENSLVSSCSSKPNTHRLWMWFISSSIGTSQMRRYQHNQRTLITFNIRPEAIQPSSMKR
ncbi:hypothetical protein F8388_022539 [Cannabis sativa]|uniref:Uncharacterized protein n=1 Tax=Cannabis sativa TaxID=3483 RepID=A0A7J6EJZ6_CANSA|nr:hypothetical protein F8388_022539 [Cannabis sativa]